jgi:hypothetical protein
VRRTVLLLAAAVALVPLRWGRPTVRVGMRRDEVEAALGPPGLGYASGCNIHLSYRETSPLGVCHTTRVEYSPDGRVVGSDTTFGFEPSWLAPCRKALGL